MGKFRLYKNAVNGPVLMMNGKIINYPVTADGLVFLLEYDKPADMTGHEFTIWQHRKFNELVNADQQLTLQFQ